LKTTNPLFFSSQELINYWLEKSQNALFMGRFGLLKNASKTKEALGELLFCTIK